MLSKTADFYFIHCKDLLCFNYKTISFDIKCISLSNQNIKLILYQDNEIIVYFIYIALYHIN